MTLKAHGCLCLALLALGSSPSLAHAARAPYVVALAKHTTPTAAADAAARAGVSVDRRFPGAGAAMSARMTRGQARALARRPEVLFVQRDETMRAAGSPRAVPGPAPAAEIVPPGVRRVGAGTRASGAAVAVVDTGIAATSELDVRGGKNCISSAAPVDDNGHGTHVAGIIGARANGSGVVGAAPGTPLYAVKVLNARKSGTLSQLLCGLSWIEANAAKLGIRVVNISITAAGADDGACGTRAGDAFHRAVCALTAQGIVVVAAAGNGTTGLERTVPAAYPEAIAVTAMTDTDGLRGGVGPAPCSRTDADDRYAAMSNFGTTAAAPAHSLAAPGVCVTSTGLKSPTAVYTGTSQAAPHVAAAAALCFNAGGGPGPCAGLGSAGVMARLRTDARSGSEGFAGDPLRAVSGRFYGPLVSARY